MSESWMTIPKDLNLWLQLKKINNDFSIWRNFKHIWNTLVMLWLCWNCCSTVGVLFLLTFSSPVNALQWLFKVGCHMIQVEPFWVINVPWMPRNKYVLSSTNLIKLNALKLLPKYFFTKLISFKLPPCIIYTQNKARLVL